MRWGKKEPGRPRKLTREQEAEVKRRRLSGEKLVVLEADYGVSQQTIRDITNTMGRA